MEKMVKTKKLTPYEEGYEFHKMYAKAVKEALEKGVEVPKNWDLFTLMKKIGKDNIVVERDRKINLLGISKEDIEYSLGITPLTDEEWEKIEEGLYDVISEIDETIDKAVKNPKLINKMIVDTTNRGLYLYVKRVVKRGTLENFQTLKSLIITSFISRNINFFNEKIKETNKLIEKYLKEHLRNCRYEVDARYISIKIKTTNDEEPVNIIIPRNELKFANIYMHIPYHRSTLETFNIFEEIENILLRLYVLLNEKGK